MCSKLLAKGSLLSVNKLLIVFGFINLLLNITITVSIVKQNLLCKIYRKRAFYIFLNEFAFKFKYNCKYCSTKSSLQNLQENDVTSF